MKAISIRQPWAGLIALGIKDIEIRSWNTNYRGPILIHAAKKIDNDPAHLEKILQEIKGDHHTLFRLAGYIIAKADLYACFPYEACDFANNLFRHFNHYSWWAKRGTYGIALANIEQLGHIIEYRGQLGIFNVPDDILEKDKL